MLKLKRVGLKGLTIGILLFLLIPFQNCGNQFIIRNPESLTSFSTAKGCDTEIFLVFQEGFYPFLRQNCAQCHTEGGQGLGHFAHPSFEIAWKEFNSIGVRAIARNAVNDSHRPPYTGSKHQSTVDALMNSWNLAYETKMQCEITSNPSLMPLSLPLKTTAKSIFNLPNVFTSISWSLYYEIENPQQRSLIPAILTIDYRVLPGPQANLLRVEFQNPRVTLQAQGSIEVKNLRLYINGHLLSDITRYSQITKTFDSMNPTPLITGNSVTFELVPAFNAPFTLAAQFDHVIPSVSITTPPPMPTNPNSPTPTPTPTPAPNLPQRVTYADLMGTNPSLNVFRASCVQCHNNNNAAGGLNLNDVNRTRLLANTILSRMTNAQRPMPTGGLLPLDRVRLVQIWVQNGAPAE